MTLAYEKYLQEILIDSAALQARVAELGAQISADYAGRDRLTLICILKGGVMFLTDLMRKITVPHEIDFLAISSYGRGGRATTGSVRIEMDLREEVSAKNLLIVEDIIDSGLTLSYLVRTLQGRKPASLEICALLTKPARRRTEVPVRYIGFEIPDRFVIGYGLDFGERYRNLPYVGVLDGPGA